MCSEETVESTTAARRVADARNRFLVVAIVNAAALDTTVVGSSRIESIEKRIVASVDDHEIKCRLLKTTIVRLTSRPPRNDHITMQRPKNNNFDINRLSTVSINNAISQQSAISSMAIDTNNKPLARWLVERQRSPTTDGTIKIGRHVAQSASSSSLVCRRSSAGRLADRQRRRRRGTTVSERRSNAKANILTERRAPLRHARRARRRPAAVAAATTAAVVVVAACRQRRRLTIRCARRSTATSRHLSGRVNMQLSDPNNTVADSGCRPIAAIVETIVAMTDDDRRCVRTLVLMRRTSESPSTHK